MLVHSLSPSTGYKSNQIVLGYGYSLVLRLEVNTPSHALTWSKINFPRLHAEREVAVEELETRLRREHINLSDIASFHLVQVEFGVCPCWCCYHTETVQCEL